MTSITPHRIETDELKAVIAKLKALGTEQNREFCTPLIHYYERELERRQ